MMVRLPTQRFRGWKDLGPMSGEVEAPPIIPPFACGWNYLGLMELRQMIPRGPKRGRELHKLLASDTRLAAFAVAEATQLFFVDGLSDQVCVAAVRTQSEDGRTVFVAGNPGHHGLTAPPPRNGY